VDVGAGADEEQDHEEEGLEVEEGGLCSVSGLRFRREETGELPLSVSLAVCLMIEREVPEAAWC
jgi:hypothetical protein